MTVYRSIALLFNYFILITLKLPCQQSTNCTPWDIPLPRSQKSKLPYCTSFYNGAEYVNSLQEFMDEMANPEIRDHCSKGCFPNCVETRYSYQMDRADLNLNDLCFEEDTRNVNKSI